jgi:hypothetical protein
LSGALSYQAQNTAAAAAVHAVAATSMLSDMAQNPTSGPKNR